MSLHPQAVPTIPEDTARVAHAAFPKGNLYLKLRDELGDLYMDEQFTDLYPIRGQTAEPPWRLALITVLQFLEDLSDRQAADAVRSRIDWKYLLSLPLDDSGFDYSVLSEFRSRLIASGQEEQLLNLLLQQCQNKGLLKNRGKQRTDSTHVLAAVRAMGRCECVGETLRHALNVLATAVPEWLETVIEPVWFERYDVRVELSRLPSKKEERQQWMEVVGKDGHRLLAAIFQVNTPQWLRQIPAVETLRQVWIQQFYLEGDQVVARTSEDLPKHQQMIVSPYDTKARNRTKRTTNWTGYCVHLTETCDEELLNLITHVETTPATVMDADLIEPIHEKLNQKNLLPSEHFVDTGYVSAEHLVNIDEQYQVEVIGPVLPDTSWQALAQNGFDLTHFTIDWDNCQVRCPQGCLSQGWSESFNPHGQAVIHVRFRRNDCLNCSSQCECTQFQSAHGRCLNFLPKAQYLALQARRQYQSTDEFKQRYAQRAGIEGSLSQGVRAFGLRHSRYIGLAKTHLQHIGTAVAMNFVRLWHWWCGLSKEHTRISRFKALDPAS